MSWLFCLQKFGSFSPVSGSLKRCEWFWPQHLPPWDAPNGSNKPFHRDAGPSVLKGMKETKVALEVISRTGSSHPVSLSPLNGQNATGRARMKGNKQAGCVWGEKWREAGALSLLNSHSRFSEGTEWWIIETWKVIKYGSLKRWGQVPQNTCRDRRF